MGLAFSINFTCNFSDRICMEKDIPKKPVNTAVTRSVHRKRMYMLTVRKRSIKGSLESGPPTRFLRSYIILDVKWRPPRRRGPSSFYHHAHTVSICHQ